MVPMTTYRQAPTAATIPIAALTQSAAAEVSPLTRSFPSRT